MDKKELELALADLKSKLEESMSAKMKAEVEAQIKALDTQLKALEKAGTDIKELKDTLDEIKEANKKNQEGMDKVFLLIKNGSLQAEQKSFVETLEDSIRGKSADLEGMKDNMKGNAALTIKAFNAKAAGTMTINNNYSGGTYGLTTWDPQFARIVRRQPFMRQLVSVRPTTSKYVAWAEQANPDGGAGMTAEGAVKSQADFDIVERTAEVKKVTAYIKTSKEALADIGYLASEINQELIELVNLKLDEQLLSGDGTGNNLKGILSYAPTFSVTGTPLANGVPDANVYDVIRAAAWQVVNNQFMPNYFVINPIQAAIMDLTKDNEGRYVIPPFTTPDGRRIAGMVGVENTGVAQDAFLIGDFAKDILAMREELNISIGYENDDFTKNLITILAEARAANYVKTNYLNAFVQGTFTAAKAALAAA
jgi:HK97 family phage major capsid protein